MKHSSLFAILCILLFSSCSNKQSIEEKKVLVQLGDSCVNRLYLTIKKRFYPYPPPPSTMILRFFDDTINAKLELNKLDTLGYPFKFSVYNFKFKNVSSVKEYYKAFSQQNEIRLSYIYENIIISDSMQIPSSVFLAEAVRNNKTLIKEFRIDSLKSSAQMFLNNKPREKSWDKEKLNKYSKFITDLRPTSIKFYRVIFNKSNTKGILILSFNIWGYVDGFACFDLETNNSNWEIKDYHWFSVHRNEKRWKIK